MKPDHLYNDFDSVVTFDYDVNAINNAIKNILFTSVGSLPGKPDFGSRISELVFSQMDYITENMLKRLIVEALSKWETRIIIVNVELESVQEFNRILATITYRLKDDILNNTTSISLNLIS